MGSAFLRNETTYSYCWLFQAFLETMNGLEPLNLITNYDLAMAAAIRVVLYLPGIDAAVGTSFQRLSQGLVCTFHQEKAWNNQQ